jgi:hypothetical protein
LVGVRILREGVFDMVKKATTKSRPRTGAKAAVAARSKDAAEAQKPKEKSGFGKRSMAASARAAAAPAKSARPSKASAKPPRKKSVIGKAVGAVTSTVANVAESAASLFRRGSPKAH